MLFQTSVERARPFPDRTRESHVPVEAGAIRENDGQRFRVVRWINRVRAVGDLLGVRPAARIGVNDERVRTARHLVAVGQAVGVGVGVLGAGTALELVAVL